MILQAFSHFLSNPQYNFQFLFTDTSAGYGCFVNDVQGSYFIRCLCKALKEQHTNTELHAIAVNVNNMVARVTAHPEENGKTTGKHLLLFYVALPSSCFLQKTIRGSLS